MGIGLGLAGRLLRLGFLLVKLVLGFLLAVLALVVVTVVLAVNAALGGPLESIAERKRRT